MSGMIQDLESSKTEIEIYKTSTHKGKPGNIEFTVQVLQNSWDIEKSKFESVMIPPYLNHCIDDFTTFYVNRHKNHKLLFSLLLVIFK